MRAGAPPWFLLRRHHFLGLHALQEATERCLREEREREREKERGRYNKKHTHTQPKNTRNRHPKEITHHNPLSQPKHPANNPERGGDDKTRYIRPTQKKQQKTCPSHIFQSSPKNDTLTPTNLPPPVVYVPALKQGPVTVGSEVLMQDRLCRCTCLSLLLL